MGEMRKSRAFFRLLLASAAAASAGRATLVPRLDFEALNAQADSIVHARVTRSWSEWDAERRFIWTHYELAVHEVLKGNAVRAMIVSEPGGALDGRTLRVAGAVRFRPGEELVLFLYRTPIGYMRTVGWGQGKFSVANGRVNGASLQSFKARIRERLR